MVNRLLHSRLLPVSALAALLARVPTSRLAASGERRTLRIFRDAARSVPAYRDFLKAHGIRPADIRTIADLETRLPPTDKTSYVDRYPLAFRCRHGRLPAEGLVEESSGSSGSPTNWVRSTAEERPIISFVGLSLDYLYPVEPGRQRIVLNGFALGAWAGGLAFARRAGRRALVKNTGPDAPKIVQTLLDLGSGGDYLISGYPPFLRRLIETGRTTRGFDWKSYRVQIFSGGEGFSEEWRAFLASALREDAKIFSTYGAIDLDAGIALETPLTVAIRRLLESDRELRRELLATERRPCFLGVYPPLSTHVCEVCGPSGARELAITQLGPHAAAPKVKYNIGDEGGVIPFRTMKAALDRRGHDLAGLAGGPGRRPVLPFPFLFILGRSDGTVSIEGSNIHAADIAEAIFSDREIAPNVESFKLAVETGADASPRLHIYVEAREGVTVDEAWTGRCAEIIIAKILETNECFRRSWQEDPVAATPRVVCLPFGAGLFAGEGSRLKHRYIG